MILIEQLSIGPIETNCYVVTCERTRQTIIIDPGWNDPVILDAVNSHKGTVKCIVDTHSHWDHIGGNAMMVEKTGAPLGLHEEAVPMLRARGGADFWNIPLPPSPEPDFFLVPGETLPVGELAFQILYTPGHAPGHISLYEPNAGVIFDGDVLFNRGIGRVDLPGGHMDILMDSIHSQLLTLPDETIVYSGHGPKTTIGEERRKNPWLTRS